MLSTNSNQPKFYDIKRLRWRNTEDTLFRPSPRTLEKD